MRDFTIYFHTTGVDNFNKYEYYRVVDRLLLFGQCLKRVNLSTRCSWVRCWQENSPDTQTPVESLKAQWLISLRVRELSFNSLQAYKRQRKYFTYYPPLTEEPNFAFVWIRQSHCCLRQFRVWLMLYLCPIDTSDRKPKVVK